MKRLNKRISIGLMVKYIRDRIFIILLILTLLIMFLLIKTEIGLASPIDEFSQNKNPNIDDRQEIKNKMVQWKVDDLKQKSKSETIKSADIDISFDSNSNINSKIGFVKPLSINDNNVTFIQSKFNYNAQGIGLQNGLGYRKIIKNKMVGINMFSDLVNNEIVRNSIGLEYYIYTTEVHVNYYRPEQPVSNETDGLDYNIRLNFLNSPWMSTAIRGYNYSGENKVMLEFNIQATPELAVKYQYSNKDSYIGISYDLFNKKSPSLKDKVKIINRNNNDRLLDKVIRNESLEKKL